MQGRQSIGRPSGASPAGRHRVAAIALMLALAPQCFDLRAELLFHSVERTGGQQRWSPARGYVNPSESADRRGSASSAALTAEEVRVVVSGRITREDLDGVEVMARRLASGRQKLADNVVWLASDGGDIDAAMALGRRLRRLRVFTFVGKDDRCLSACVFAFMGGERRSVAGQLGIHRPYFPFTQDTPDRPARFRHLQGTLRNYIEELDFPSSLYEAIMAVPPESVHLLSPAELKRFYLEGISPLSEDRADAAAARRLGISMFEYLKRKAKTPACAFAVAPEDRCDDSTQAAAGIGVAADGSGSMPKHAAPAGRAAGRPTGENAQDPGSPRGEARGVPGSS